MKTTKTTRVLTESINSMQTKNLATSALSNCAIKIENNNVNEIFNSIVQLSSKTSDKIRSRTFDIEKEMYKNFGDKIVIEYISVMCGRLVHIAYSDNAEQSKKLDMLNIIDGVQCFTFDLEYGIGDDRIARFAKPTATVEKDGFEDVDYVLVDM